MAEPRDKSRRAKGPRKAAAQKPDAGTQGTKKAHDGQNNELTLVQREMRYRLMFERSNDAIQLVSADCRILYSSPSVVNILGYTPEEIQGVVVYPFIHPDDLPVFRQVWQKMLSKPEHTVTLQYRVQHREGDWVWLETTASNYLDLPEIGAVVGNFRNITKRKVAEANLKESEARLRFMAESMPQMIFTITPDNRLDYFSPQWVEYTGLSLKTLLHDCQKVIELVHPDDRAATLEAWHKSFDARIPLERQYRLCRKDGAYRWHICRIRPMKEKDGSVKIWVGSCTDIDDLQTAMRSQHELELKATALKAQRAELLALNQAKDEFISLASHQLRTPATGVKQYLGMLLHGFAGPLSDDQKAFMQTAYESNERQISIINDLLQVARIDAGKIKLRLRRTNVVRLVKQVINEHVGEIASRQQRIIIKGGDQVLNARVDGDRICMVLDNILDNASKYTPSDKSITVSLTTQRQGTRVRVAVTDQGVGMSAADVGKIFQKFSRLESPLTKSVDGSGLGLYWARKIVELHGGDITVNSKPGSGTTFIISLPV